MRSWWIFKIWLPKQVLLIGEPALWIKRNWSKITLHLVSTAPTHTTTSILGHARKGRTSKGVFPRRPRTSKLFVTGKLDPCTLFVLGYPKPLPRMGLADYFPSKSFVYCQNIQPDCDWQIRFFNYCSWNPSLFAGSLSICLSSSRSAQ